MDEKDDELHHYGVLGMKWGVRKYQNKGGSLTRAGLKRFDKSKKDYETTIELNKALRTVSPALKDDQTISYNLKRTNQLKKQQKKQMRKDYKHLKQDYLADKGKARYAKGERIMAHGRTTAALLKVGGLSVSAAAVAYNKQFIDSKTRNILAGIGGATIVAGGIKTGVDAYKDRQLRAYYGHSSNY